jgi:hypothetical protein
VPVVKQLLGSDRVDINHNIHGQPPDEDMIELLLDSGKVDANDVASLQNQLFRMKRRLTNTSS